MAAKKRRQHILEVADVSILSCLALVVVRVLILLLVQM